MKGFLPQGYRKYPTLATHSRRCPFSELLEKPKKFHQNFSQERYSIARFAIMSRSQTKTQVLSSGVDHLRWEYSLHCQNTGVTDCAGFFCALASRLECFRVGPGSGMAQVQGWDGVGSMLVIPSLSIFL